MGKKKIKGPKPKRTPQRTCIACRAVAGKRTLIRIVRTDDGVRVDASGKLSGRGAYIHPDRTCWQLALDSRRIEQALRTRLSADERQELFAFAESLPPSDADSGALNVSEIERTTGGHK